MCARALIGPLLGTLIGALLGTLAGCGDKARPPTWEALLAAKVVEQYPAYAVHTAPDKLLIDRPGLPSVTVEVAPIEKMCQRGPKDCNYATEQMLMELRPPEPVTPAKD